MSNEYFDSTINLQDFTRARGAPINALSAQTEAAFDMLPSSVTFKKNMVPTVTAGGTANAITVANELPITSYEMGQRISFKAIATNTGAATVNVDGLGVKAIRRADGTALSAGDITNGRIVDLVYDGTNFTIVGTIVTINAAGTDLVISDATTAATNAQTSATAAEEARVAAEAAIAPYTASDVLAKLVTVDGSGSGVDADLVRGTTPSATGLSILGSASDTAIKTTLGLENVNNTSDENKPVSTATQAALDLKAPIASPTFTGTVTLPGAPTADNHAATKAWVEQSIEGLTNTQPKAAVACVAVSNITLSGEQTIDGVTTSASRVLVAGQTTAAQNGIYVSGAGAWTRSTDADTWAELAFATALVSGGTTYPGTNWQVLAPEGGTLGTTDLTVVQTSAAAIYTASNGITKSELDFQLSTIATSRLLGNVSGSTAVPTALTGTQVTATLDTFTSSTKGLAPACPSSTTTRYLRGDGSWTSTLTPSSVSASGSITGSNLSGTNTGDQTITLTGAVTGSGTGSFATTLADNTVTMAKLADIATATVIGRSTAGTGDPSALSMATLKGMLDLSGTNTGDQTSVSGNAGTATALQTPRTIAISGGATGTATSFDGSANVTIPVTAIDVSTASAGTLAVARGGTGTTTSTGTGSVVLATSPTLSSPTLSNASFSGALLAADGTASAPGYSFSGDTNTGMYRFGGDAISFAAGGAERLRVNTTSVFVATGVLSMSSMAVSSLPAASSFVGARAFVTDATSTTFASIVAGGGANGVPVYSDGSNWRIG